MRFGTIHSILFVPLVFAFEYMQRKETAWQSVSINFIYHFALNKVLNNIIINSCFLHFIDFIDYIKLVPRNNALLFEYCDCYVFAITVLYIFVLVTCAYLA